MPLTILDVIVIVVVLISAVLAMVRGFVREVLSVASWVAAVAAAYFLYKPLLAVVKGYFQSGTVALIVSAAAIFFVALIVASYITMKISDFVIDSRVGALDRALGFLFGAARGVLLLVIALAFFNWLVQKPPTWVATARSGPMLADLGERLKEALPAELEANIQEWARSREGEPAGDSSPPPEGDAAPPDSGDAPDDSGSNLPASGKDKLNQLIQNNAATPGD